MPGLCPLCAPRSGPEDVRGPDRSSVRARERGPLDKCDPGQRPTDLRRPVLRFQWRYEVKVSGEKGGSHRGATPAATEGEVRRVRRTRGGTGGRATEAQEDRRVQGCPSKILEPSWSPGPTRGREARGTVHRLPRKVSQRLRHLFAQCGSHLRVRRCVVDSDLLGRTVDGGGSV